MLYAFVTSSDSAQVPTTWKCEALTLPAKSDALIVGVVRFRMGVTAEACRELKLVKRA